MDLYEDLNNEITNNSSIIHNSKQLNQPEAKQIKFTDSLKKILNKFDSDEVLIKKVVETALTIEFDNKIAQSELNKMVEIISGVYTHEAALQKELIFIARSIIELNDNHKIVLH